MSARPLEKSRLLDVAGVGLYRREKESFEPLAISKTFVRENCSWAICVANAAL